MLIEHDRLDLAERLEPRARVLAALMRAAFVRPLRAHRDLRAFLERAVEVDDAVRFGVLGKDGALALPTDRGLEAVGDHFVFATRLDLDQADLLELVEVGLAARSEDGAIRPARGEVANGRAVERLVSPLRDAVINDGTQRLRNELRRPGDGFARNHRRSRKVELRTQRDHLGEATERFVAIGGLVVTRLLGCDHDVVARREVVAEHEVAGRPLHECESFEILLVGRCPRRRLAGDEEDVLTLLADVRDELVGSIEQQSPRFGRMELSRMKPRELPSDLPARPPAVVGRDAGDIEVRERRREDDATRLGIARERLEELCHVLVGEEVVESSAREERLRSFVAIRSAERHPSEDELDRDVRLPGRHEGFGEEREQRAANLAKGRSGEREMRTNVRERTTREDVKTSGHVSLLDSVVRCL